MMQRAAGAASGEDAPATRARRPTARPAASDAQQATSPPPKPLGEPRGLKFPRDRLPGPLARRVGETLVKRDDGRVEGHENERELYRKIIRRAKAVRERAADSLRRSRAVKGPGDVREHADAAQRRRRVRRHD
jgi:hypothetical protein